MKNRKYNISNLKELQASISSLKIEHEIQGKELGKNVKVYLQQFTPFNLIKKLATPSNLLKADDQLNVTGKLMSFILPVLLNTTLFRGSGFITKTLVGLATSKVGKNLDAEHLTGIFSSIKSFFKGGTKPKVAKVTKHIDYGIPPESETY